MNCELKKILLTIDIGNSTIGLGLFPEPEKDGNIFIKKIPAYPARTAAHYKKVITAFIKKNIAISHEPSVFIDAVISSVVTALTGPIREAVRDICGKRPLTVSHKIKSGLTFEVLQPGKVGADRIANAVGGYHAAGGPAAVVDFGTATTMTVVGENARFLGGVIMPGLQLMQKALAQETARLPRVPLTAQQAVLGRDTASAIRSGIIHGTAGAVEILLKKIEKELGYKVQLVLTGGNAKLLSPLMERRHLFIPPLTFQGLRLIYLSNRGLRPSLHKP
ncbi:MAG: type III pantothenate kinase [Nitrospirota bacterium]